MKGTVRPVSGFTVYWECSSKSMLEFPHREKAYRTGDGVEAQPITEALLDGSRTLELRPCSLTGDLSTRLQASACGHTTEMMPDQRLQGKGHQSAVRFAILASFHRKQAVFTAKAEPRHTSTKGPLPKLLAGRIFCLPQLWAQPGRPTSLLRGLVSFHLILMGKKCQIY